MSSVYVVCWIFLQTFQTYFCIQTNSVDPDQTEQYDLGPNCLQKWKMSSVYVVCWIFLQTFQTYFCIQANSVDPDQTEQYDLGPNCLQKWLLKSQADDNADDNCCDWQFMG